ncbi:MAG: DUF2079 domain-containing protein [Ktedonobacterales bacterium]
MEGLPRASGAAVPDPAVPGDSGRPDAAPAGDVAAPASDATVFARARRLYVRITDRYPYPKLAPAPRGNRAGLVVVGLLALAFVVYFVAFTWAKHDAYQTFAEDMGIMDQALWNLAHGFGLRQTICNPIGDANCLGDVSRLAIHFEPIMYVVGLLYLVAPSPKTLQLIQAVVVAAGALPAYWIASRRLGSVLAGIGFAAIYLLYPALQAAVTYDFHAVTLSAAFLMFALYFMLSRNTVGLLIACVLALATKENIPADVFLIGASVVILQRRPKIGLLLCALSLGWLAIELPIMHAASPVGYSPTAGRYTYLGSSPVKAGIYLLTHPVQVLRAHVLDAGGRFYLRTLFSPTGYLALLSPLSLLLAVPAIAINVLSSFPSQRSGIYHYNAEIVPFLVLASIETVAWIAALVAWLARRGAPLLATPRLAPVMTRARAASSRVVSSRVAGALRVRPREPGPATPLTLPAVAGRSAALALVAVVLLFSLHEQVGHGYLPITQNFSWPQQTPHTRLADSFIQLIPPAASVSAQSELVPHISQRRYIYQFPFADSSAAYVFLDITASPYPFNTPDEYFAAVRALLATRTVHVVAARDGYLLLAHGAGPSLNPANPYGLPDSLFSFSELPANTAIPHPTAAVFGSSLKLVGYDITPTTHPVANTYVYVTTYWQTTGPLAANDLPQLIETRPDGTYLGVSTFAATALRPLSQWRPGTTYVLRAPVFVTGHEAGRDLLGVRVQSGTGDTPQDFLDATLPVPAAAGGFPSLDPDRKQAIFTSITVG